MGHARPHVADGPVMAAAYHRPYAPGVAAPDDDMSRLLRRMVDTMDRSTGEASRQAVAYLRTLGVIDELVGQVDALGAEVATLDERVRKLEKADRKRREEQEEEQEGEEEAEEEEGVSWRSAPGR